MEAWVKRFFKLIFLSLSFLIVSPLIVFSKCEKLFSYEGFFHGGGHLCAIAPGTIGNLIRLAYAMGTLEKCHHTAIIEFGTYFSKRNSIIEKNVGIGAYCIIGECHLKANSKLASRVSIISGLHEHGKTKDFLSGKEAKNALQLSIGPNTWIGEGSTIGANIGKKSVVSMGAVVFKNIDDERMAMGNPARELPLGK